MPASLAPVIATLALLPASGLEVSFQRGDSNDDGRIDVSDPVATLGFLFLGGPAPPPPQGACGRDPSPDDLGCKRYTRCPECLGLGDLGVQSSGSIFRICLPEPEDWGRRGGPIRPDRLRDLTSDPASLCLLVPMDPRRCRKWDRRP